MAAESKPFIEQTDEERQKTKQAALIAAGLWGIIQVRETAMGVDTASSGGTPSADQVRTAFLALVVETLELLNELPWKPWKKQTVPDKTKVAHEFADILAFTAVLMRYLSALVGLSPTDLALAYTEKMDIVHDRLKGNVEGYDPATDAASSLNAVTDGRSDS